MGAIFDPGNDVYDELGEVPYPDGYNCVKGYIRHVHIKDAVKNAAGEPECVKIGTGLVRYPELYNLTPAEFRKFADEHGLFFAQAHPFRVMCSPRDPKDLHGVEVFNGNARHNSHNDTAEAFAAEHHLVRLSGSDFHEWDDLCLGGIYLEKIPQSSAELAQMLLGGEVSGLKIPGKEKE